MFDNIDLSCKTMIEREKQQDKENDANRRNNIIFIAVFSLFGALVALKNQKSEKKIEK